LAQVVGDELHVQQRESGVAKPRHQVRQGNLGGVPGAREHALAEKGTAQSNAVQPANQLTVLPGFDAVRVSHCEQFNDGVFDCRIDPGFRAVFVGFGAQAKDIGEGGVQADLERAAADGFLQPPGNMNIVQWQDAANLRIDPKD